MPDSEKPKRKRSFKLHIDEVKLRHTTHWDSDYMSREEFDAYMRGEGPATQEAPCEPPAASPTEQAKPPVTAWERFLGKCLGRGKKP